MNNKNIKNTKKLEELKDGWLAIAPPESFYNLKSQLLVAVDYDEYKTKEELSEEHALLMGYYHTLCEVLPANGQYHLLSEKNTNKEGKVLMLARRDDENTVTLVLETDQYGSSFHGGFANGTPWHGAVGGWSSDFSRRETSLVEIRSNGALRLHRSKDRNDEFNRFDSFPQRRETKEFLGPETSVTVLNYTVSGYNTVLENWKKETM